MALSPRKSKAAMRLRKHQFTPIRRQVRLPVWGDLGIRLGLVVVLLFLVVLIHWWDHDGLADSLDGDVSFLDVIYFTMISVTTTGFGDITPVTDRSRFIEAIIVTPVRVAVIFIFVGAAYSFVIKRSWEKWRMGRIQSQLEDHIVVLGFGVSGSEAVGELIERGTDPSCIVVMDTGTERLAAAEAMGCNVIEADATRDDALKSVRIDEAQTVLVSAGRDDSSILIVLTVRHLAPNVPISVVVRAADNELLARQAGANNVINPVRFTGLLLAGSAQGAHIAEYLADLASVSGRVQLVERPVREEEIGKPLSQLSSNGRGLRIYRNGGACGFWEHEADCLQAGDIVVEIRATDLTEKEGENSTRD